MDHISLSLLFSIIKFLFSPVTKLLRWIYNKLPFKVVGKKNNPKLGIIESSWRDHMWDYGKQGDKEVVVVYTYWQITNTLPYNLTALNVFPSPEECDVMTTTFDFLPDSSGMNSRLVRIERSMVDISGSLEALME